MARGTERTKETGSRSASDGYAPLFETKKAEGILIYRVFAATILVGICMVWIYRLIPLITDQPEEDEEENMRSSSYSYLNSWWYWWGWTGMLCAELWFGFYWILSQALRWNRVYRCTFKDRLSQRYGEKELPGVDIFVCTADPVIEPPIMVINTVLSVMSYDYPSSKLSVYLSDDGGSELTFYALLEASTFSKSWLPFCRKYNVQTTSPMAFFKTNFMSAGAHNIIVDHKQDFNSVKKLYDEMEARVIAMTNLGRVSEDERKLHKGFALWNSTTTKQDHHTILQILIDGRNSEAIDNQGCRLPTLVYLAREKRPQHFHNFKAGAMNALIRVSSAISNGPIILNVDCDMYSNNVQSIREALCFFMDEKQSRDIAFVQFPVQFQNITNNDIYASSLRTILHVEFPGIDGYGGAFYVGSGCFHRRDVLCRGRKMHDTGSTTERQESVLWGNQKMTMNGIEIDLEEKAIPLASSTYDLINSKWGRDIGLKYGCPVEDILTGLSIQCRGWKSVYCNNQVGAGAVAGVGVGVGGGGSGFLGLGPTTLLQTLVQHKRWSEGHLQICLSKNCALWLGRNGRIPFGLQLSYLYYGLWATNCFAVLTYTTIPSLFLLKANMPLFPKASSPWFLPFAYVAIASYGASLVEYLWSGGTYLGWWNEQRIWLYKRTSSYLFACTDCIANRLGLSNLKFAITSKVMDEDVERRYAREIIEFGVTSPMFTILTTLALLNLYCLAILVLKGHFDAITGFGNLTLQSLLCVALVVINIPLYEALFLRKDKGKMPSCVTVMSSAVALALISLFAF